MASAIVVVPALVIVAVALRIYSWARQPKSAANDAEPAHTLIWIITFIGGLALLFGGLAICANLGLFEASSTHHVAPLNPPVRSSESGLYSLMLVAAVVVFVLPATAAIIITMFMQPKSWPIS